MRETHIIGSMTREWIVPHSIELKAAGIFMVGMSDAVAPFTFVRAPADYPQLLVCYSGRGRVWLNDRWVSCPTGAAYVTPAGCDHAYHALKSPRWKVCWILYSKGSRGPVTGVVPKILRFDPRPLRDAIKGLYRETVASNGHVALRAWVQLIRIYADQYLRDDRAGDILWRVWNAATNDLGRDWSVPNLAAVISVSGEHLRRLCQAHLGCAPMHHLKRLRMDRAATLLAATPQKIEPVANAVGFANRFAFSNAFKAHFGQSPAEYRAANRR